MNLPGVTLGPTKKMGPIGSVVLMFIGYKRTPTPTNKQTDKQSTIEGSEKKLQI